MTLLSLYIIAVTQTLSLLRLLVLLLSDSLTQGRNWRPNSEGKERYPFCRVKSSVVVGVTREVFKSPILVLP